MKMRNGTIYLAASLALLASCTKAPQTGVGYVSDPDAVRIDASVGMVTKSNPLGTAEEQAKFNKGDKITVIHTTANKLVNYVFDGTSWAPEGEDYLVWQTDAENTFTLRYPAGVDWDHEYLSKDQSTIEEMRRSDRMLAENVKFDKIPDDRQIKATLARQRSLITVEIAGFNDEFSSEDAKVADLQLYLWDGSQGDEINAVTPYIRDAQGAHQPKGTAGLVGYTYTAIGRNDCKYGNKPFIKLTVAGKELTVPNPSDMVVGKHYTYRLTVGKNTVKLSGVTVEAWTPGGTVDGTHETVTDRYSVWDGKSVEDPQGYGTEEDPYVISSAAQLAGFAKLVNDGNDFRDKYIKLDANIDLNGLPWTPVGNRSNMFKGHFNGNVKVITNMTVADGVSDAGLFGTAFDATISNVILRNGKVSGKSTYSALLVADGSSVTVESCKVDGTVKNNGVYGVSGGLVGRIDGKSKISNCEVNVDCYGDQYSGGIVGYGGHEEYSATKTTVESCTVRGVVFSGSRYVGGLAGSLYGSGTMISDCVSYADLKSSRVTNSSMGGLIAQINGGTVKDCSVYGRISCGPVGGNNSVVGGVFGTATDVTISGLKFEGYMDVNKDCNNDTDIEFTGYFIGKIQNSIMVTDKCTYKKAGTKTLKAVASYPDGVDITKIEEAI